MRSRLPAITPIVTLFGSPAVAADMAFKAPLPPPAATWSGFYVGAGTGAAWDTIDGNFILPPPANWSTSQTAGLFGPQVGVQRRFGPVVLGVEGDFLFLFGNSSGTDVCHPAASCAPGTIVSQHLRSGLWTAGGRVGYPVNSWMPYVSGGYAGTSATLTFLPAPIETGTTDHNGGYVGGGFDYMIMPHLVAGIEYRHYFFASASTVPVTAAGPNPGDLYSATATADSVMVRLSWLFGWNGTK